jgi:hypothetical protein
VGIVSAVAALLCFLMAIGTTAFAWEGERLDTGGEIEVESYDHQGRGKALWSTTTIVRASIAQVTWVCDQLRETVWQARPLTIRLAKPLK